MSSFLERGTNKLLSLTGVVLKILPHDACDGVVRATILLKTNSFDQRGEHDYVHQIDLYGGHASSAVKNVRQNDVVHVKGRPSLSLTGEYATQLNIDGVSELTVLVRHKKGDRIRSVITDRVIYLHALINRIDVTNNKAPKIYCKTYSFKKTSTGQVSVIDSHVVFCNQNFLEIINKLEMEDLVFITATPLVYRAKGSNAASINCELRTISVINRVKNKSRR
ncbi:hypothetical protein [Photobacterium leiognathi]|uniref:hypothetical protein n=1 Tax=Photobacterium leiognathi TaxID=553611 RepID=UPI002981995B|nr:hypothetical protein [Photobacterium leiognathi]